MAKGSDAYEKSVTQLRHKSHAHGGFRGLLGPGGEGVERDILREMKRGRGWKKKERQTSGRDNILGTSPCCSFFSCWISACWVSQAEAKGQRHS